MALWGKSRRGNGSGETVLFFATDVHGSEVCFRKFVAAADFYGADVLILGGDLTGKFVVPVVDRGDGHYAVEISGRSRSLKESELPEAELRLANQGFYPFRTDAAGAARLASDPAERERVTEQLVLERIERWIAYARERLDGTGTRIITAPGNDDPPAIDDLIRRLGGDTVVIREGEIVEVAPGHQMLSTGYSNPTPWHTHRELPEDRIAEVVASMADRLDAPEGAIFNIHVPPFDTGLDRAPAVNDDLSVKTAAGEQVMEPVGSTAVREAIESRQPLLSLHGHIHEAGGSVRIGRTVAINAGSEYAEGVLRGVLVAVGNGELIRYQATTG